VRQRVVLEQTANVMDVEHVSIWNVFVILVGKVTIVASQNAPMTVMVSVKPEIYVHIQYLKNKLSLMHKFFM
jgi:hypothetical protein